MALGPVELASAGASIALFNQALKISVAPLVSITTSFVAEEDTMEKINTIAAEKHFNESVKAESNQVTSNDHLPQDIKLENSETPTEDFAANVEKNDAFAVPQNVDKESTLRSEKNNEDGNKKRHLASGSTALLFGTILGLLQATILISAAKPLLGVIGLKHSFFINKGSPMLLPAIKYLRLRALGSPAVLLFLVMQGIFRGFKDTKTPLYVIGGLVLARIVAATFCVTLSASFAARLGPIEMAAFQTCLQVWLTSSLLADGLAVAGQAILACSFAEKDYEKLTAASARTVQFGIVLGLGLSLVVGIGLYFGAGIFSKSILVVNLIRIVVPVIVSSLSVAPLFLLYKRYGFIGIWIGLTIYMSLRMFAGVWRIGTGTGPWRFLREARLCS
ncbi:hypothetical protein Lal_00024271 [Lupinus albus]|nr:hypothetical protein Lal_00024271 [Lupinus albus]